MLVDAAAACRNAILATRLAGNGSSSFLAKQQKMMHDISRNYYLIVHNVLRRPWALITIIIVFQVFMMHNSAFISYSATNQL